MDKHPGTLLTKSRKLMDFWFMRAHGEIYNAQIPCCGFIPPEGRHLASWIYFHKIHTKTSMRQFLLTFYSVKCNLSKGMHKPGHISLQVQQSVHWSPSQSCLQAPAPSTAQHPKLTSHQITVSRKHLTSCSRSKVTCEYVQVQFMK